MPWEWVEPGLFYEHLGVRIYRVYRHDMANDKREYWYTLNPYEEADAADEGPETGVFAVRSLPRYTSIQQHEAVIKHAIEAGYFAGWNRGDDS